MNEAFNLVDEPWIILTNSKRVSLLDIFKIDINHKLGGTPVEVITILKLLQCITQAACNLSEDEYGEMDIEEFSSRCANYLQTHKHLFNLYDSERPFLQFPELNDLEPTPFSSITPHQVTVNVNKSALNTFQFQKGHLPHAERAYKLLQQQGFAFGGKGVNTSLCLSDTHVKTKTGSYGPSLGYCGFLHSFIFGSTLLETLFINFLTTDEIDLLTQFPTGLGTAPWELMPTSENCKTAEALANSVMGRFIPMNRFCLLKDTGICVIEGIKYLTHKAGIVDLSVTLIADKEYKAIWANTEKAGWREAESILSFLNESGSNKTNLQVKFALDHAFVHHISNTALVSLGLAVTNNSGEQYVSGVNDFVYSELKINAEKLNSILYGHLQKEWDDLNKCASILSKCISNFYKDQYAKTQKNDISSKVPKIVSATTAKPCQFFGKNLIYMPIKFPKFASQHWLEILNRDYNFGHRSKI